MTADTDLSRRVRKPVMCRRAIGMMWPPRPWQTVTGRIVPGLQRGTSIRLFTQNAAKTSGSPVPDLAEHQP